MCESDEDYVPLNDGFNWKGDPNATFTGQGVPQYPPGADPRQAPGAGPPVAFVPYDPATGGYLGPDGKRYTEADLANPGTRPGSPCWCRRRRSSRNRRQGRGFGH